MSSKSKKKHENLNLKKVINRFALDKDTERLVVASVKPFLASRRKDAATPSDHVVGLEQVENAQTRSQQQFMAQERSQFGRRLADSRWTNTAADQMSRRHRLDVSALDEILCGSSCKEQRRPPANTASDHWRSAFLAKRQHFSRQVSQASVKPEPLMAAKPIAKVANEKPFNYVTNGTATASQPYQLERSSSERNLHARENHSSRRPFYASPSDWMTSLRLENSHIRRCSSWNTSDCLAEQQRGEGILNKAVRAKQPSWKAWHTVMDAIVSEERQRKVWAQYYNYERQNGSMSLPRSYGASPRQLPNFAELDQILTSLGAQDEPRSRRRVTFGANTVAHRIEEFECRRPLTAQQPVKTPFPMHDVNSRVWDCALPSSSGRAGSAAATLPKVKQQTLKQPFTKVPRVDIPRFHFPYGQASGKEALEMSLKSALRVFNNYDGQADLDCMGEVARAVGLPSFLRQPLFSICSGDTSEQVAYCTFESFWRRICQTYHDKAALVVRILTKDTADYLLPLDFIAVVQDVIDHHPGLECLRDARAYHSTYLETVISRIFFDVSRHWSDRIGVKEVQRSKLIGALHKLDNEQDINNVREYFSYEHFYVIYSTFWYLDDDHDLYITKHDLKEYNNRALSERIVDRIMSTAVNCNLAQGSGKMAYSDFIWFLLAEVDKTHPKSVEYWFRCMDIDGDGFLSIYELEYFYEEQTIRLEEMGIVAPVFADIVCQMLDLVQPKAQGKIALSDLRHSCHVTYFFDTFFNREKYALHEEYELNKAADEMDGDMDNDWDRFASRAYQRFMSTEAASPEETEISCDTEDPEAEEEEGDAESQNDQSYRRLAERVAMFKQRTV